MTTLYRGRLAPSPTGAQHVGNARTYLIAWLRARAAQGRLLLRLEDIDSPRVKPGADQQALEDLRWLGLDWDEGPVVQTQRMSLYESAFQQLQQHEAVYPCTCSRSEVERAASAPHEETPGAIPTYPGTCAARQVEFAQRLTSPYSWRVRVPDHVLDFVDGVHGMVSLRLRELGGDFVVWKSSGTPAYQLAVVVDDADGHITEIVRGEDLIPSTPRQLWLYHLLGKPAPQFVHVPLVVGSDGRRLAKRHGDTRLSALRQAGVRAEALLGLLAWSCGWLTQPREISATDLLPVFSLESIPRTPFVLTNALLRAIGYSGAF